MSATILSALLNGVVLSLVLAAALELLSRVSRDRFWNASTRYTLWLAALCITVGLPLAYLMAPWMSSVDSIQVELSSTVPPHDVPEGPAVTLPIPEGGTLPRVPQTQAVWNRWLSGVEIPPGPWSGWVLALWGVAGGLMLVRLPLSYVWLHRRRARAASSPLSSRANAWMARCGSARRIRIAVSPDVASPVAIGPFRPVVLIPARLLDKLDAEQLEQIGLHESAHLARWDDVVLLFQRVLVAAFVLHPVVHWIAARLDVERELACDDAVVAATGRPRHYAACLTRVAELANGLAGSPLAASAVENRTVLERRLDVLLDKNRRPGMHLFRSRLSAVLPLMLLGVGITLVVPQWLVFAKAPVGTTRSSEAGIRGQSVTDSAKAEAREDLNRGVEAFNNGDLNNAVNYFGRASQLDPGLTVASLYYATAYVAMYNPKAPETRDNASRAVRILEDLLVKEPENIEAITGLGVIYQMRGELRTARDEFLKAAQLEPPNAAVLYSVGALDWILLRDTAAPPTPNEKMALVDEGLEYIDKALAQNAFYIDAMAYRNLLLREKAKLVSNPEEQGRLTAEADEWFAKALKARKVARNLPEPKLPTTVALAQRAGGAAAPPPAPPPPPPPPPRERSGAEALVRIGGDVAKANLVSRVNPLYPAVARSTRIQGVVILQTTIDRQGTVRDVRVISGHPLLNDAAMDAVRQWTYKPQLLNGQPVDVITTVTVNFAFTR